MATFGWTRAAAGLLLLLGRAPAFQYEVRPEHRRLMGRRRAQFAWAADRCAPASRGAEFVACTLRVLNGQGCPCLDGEASCLCKGGAPHADDPFPFVAHTYPPFAYPEVAGDPVRHGLLFHELVVNYTCARTDLGTSPAVEAREWRWPAAAAEEEDCHTEPERRAAGRHHVDVLQHEPLVAVARSFASATVCERLVAQDTGQYARGPDCSGCGCYLDVDIAGAGGEVQGFVSRLEALVRHLSGMAVDRNLTEPIRIVSYGHNRSHAAHRGGSFTGCRQHCDGGCVADWMPQQAAVERTRVRVATSIAYCRLPDAGGATIFPRAGLSFEPRSVGDVLIFAYGALDDGGSLEHAGCPIRGGQKFIATVWHDLWQEAG